MSPSLLPIIVYLTVFLIVLAVLLLVRDLFRRTPKPDGDTIDLASLLPSSDANRRDESWLGQIALEIGMGFSAGSLVLLVVLVALLCGGGLYVWRDDIVAAAAGAVLGVICVVLSLTIVRTRKRRVIRDQLPDIMELMARAVRAGESLDQAIQLAGKSGIRPVAGEFRYCAGQMKMGLSLETAIRRMVNRIPLVETRILAMTLILQRRRGGSLSLTLERLARVFRDRGNFYRQFHAATALGRGSAVLIAILAIGLDSFVLMSNSEYTQNLLTTTEGRIMFSIAVTLQVVGIGWAVWLFRSRR